MQSAKSKCFNLIMIVFFAITVSNCTDYTSSAVVMVDKNPTALVITEESKETEEAKAICLAEEFIKINGYTDSPADRDKITRESIEWESSLDELLETTKNTLESKAYGVLDEAEDSKGWTVVFICKGCDPSKTENGRAVTMNQKFKNLRLEHKEIILKYVKTKLWASSH
jgi:hypothetical protein